MSGPFAGWRARAKHDIPIDRSRLRNWGFCFRFPVTAEREDFRGGGIAGARDQCFAADDVSVAESEDRGRNVQVLTADSTNLMQKVLFCRQLSELLFYYKLTPKLWPDFFILLKIDP